LLTANFSHKETIRGKLRPTGTEARVSSQESGVIASVYVTDGARVTEGQRLVSITGNRVLADGTKLGEDVLATLQKERHLLSLRLVNMNESAEIAGDDMDQRIADTERRARERRRQLSALRARIDTAVQRVNDTETFLAEGLITTEAHMLRVDELASFRATQFRLEADISAAEAEQSALTIELQRMRDEHDQKRTDIEQRLSEIDGQVRQTKTNSEYVVAAPFSGRVFSLQARPGQRVEPNQTLLTISPNDAELIAELYLPSRTIALVEIGNPVKLHYDAFPYQKFGIAEGEVIHVSATALLPEELGIASPTPEPLYRVDVSLAKQTMRAFGNETSLQSGMELSADIVLEDRKLVEWLLEPL
ncbi:MAG: HlyD family efflux transporter periplasmic adaptor subunit, partial [Pseudomonadota bacterium]